MTVYTYGQLEGLWIAAGGPASVASTMAAIALAESGGNPDSNNYSDNGGTQTSWGLWQVSNGTHDDWLGDADDPMTNAQEAVAKYQANGFEPWGTYPVPALSLVQNGVTPVTWTGEAASASDLTQDTGTAQESGTPPAGGQTQTAASALSSDASRLGKLIVAGIVALVAVYLLVRESPAVQTAAKVARKGTELATIGGE